MRIESLKSCSLLFDLPQHLAQEREKVENCTEWNLFPLCDLHKLNGETGNVTFIVLGGSRRVSWTLPWPRQHPLRSVTSKCRGALWETEWECAD